MASSLTFAELWAWTTYFPLVSRNSEHLIVPRQKYNWITILWFQRIWHKFIDIKQFFKPRHSYNIQDIKMCLMSCNGGNGEMFEFQNVLIIVSTKEQSHCRGGDMFEFRNYCDHKKQIHCREKWHLTLEILKCLWSQ